MQYPFHTSREQRVTWGLILCLDADLSLGMYLSKSLNLPLHGEKKINNKADTGSSSFR